MHPPLGALLGALSDRWLLAFAVAALVVLAGGWVARNAARKGANAPDSDAQVRGLRRRAGALLAAGPVAGFLVAPTAGNHVAIAAAGALALAIFGAVFERRRDFGRWVALAAAGAALFAVGGGVRLEPTGVGFLDVVFGFGLVLGITLAVDGLGNADSLVPGLGTLSAFALLALGGFAEQFGLANGAAGILGACVAFLAFNTRPASLFPGRGGRLALGFALAVLACSVQPVTGPPSSLSIPLMVLGVPTIDALVVMFDRAQRRRPVLEDRRDHLVHRLVALGAKPHEAVGVLLVVQGFVVVLAILGGRDVISMWIAAPVSAVTLGALGSYSLRAPLERMAPVGLPRRAWWVIVGLALILAAAVIPLMLEVPGVTDTMQGGRAAAQRGLAAARNGDAGEAELQFRRAAGRFEQASSDLQKRYFDAARVVPVLAPNLRAVRALADIGKELAHNGEVVTADVVPENLVVVDGKMPLDEIERITPTLQKGADTLEESLARLKNVSREPYLLGSVRETIDTVRRELKRAATEARNTATAAELAPAIFGANGEERRYLLVVQNPAEVRGTGGLIGSFGILTTKDGEIEVGRLLRTSAWNQAMDAAADPTYVAPQDYVRRYAQFLPETNLQSVNLSPHFPTVGGVLASLTEEAGLGDVDGVIAVDPAGLAAILQLTGPVPVAGWPTEISANNVVGITLRDAYAAFARTPERADFLGDVAQVVVDEATNGELGEPAKVAQVLGEAAHQGHLQLAFTRKQEQRLVENLRVAGRMVRGGDVLHVTDANLAGNKLDFYLKRDLDYRVEVAPDAAGRGADATGSLKVRLENTAPKTGLPRIVAGPYEGAPPGQYAEGENVTYLSVYNPLDLVESKLDGEPVAMTTNEELGTNVYSTVVRVNAQQGRTVELDLAGRLRVGRDGWYVLEIGRQPTVNDDRARISVSVPEGYKITKAIRLQKVFGRRATGIIKLDRPTTVRVKIVADPSSFWDQLDTGY